MSVGPTVKSVALTIAIPSYKRASALNSLLQQILVQAEPDDEILVSDDDSGEETAAVVESLSRVRLIRHMTNLGMVGNWNACLTAAHRDWICIIHDDDQLAPGGLATLRRACALAGGPALVAPVAFNADREGTFRYRYAEPGRWAVLHAPSMPSGVVVHRQIVETVGTFDPSFAYSTDLEYFPRICTRFPMLVIESPAVMDVQFHGGNYQLRTWQRPDFLPQLQALHRTIAGYAGLTGTEAAKYLDALLTGNLSYMFSHARYWRDAKSMRQLSRKLLFRSEIRLPYRLVVLLAAATGWTIRPRVEPWGRRDSLD